MSGGSSIKAVPLAIVWALLLNEASNACVVPRSVLKEKAHADSIFFGTVVGVDRSTPGSGGAFDRAATITFDVHRTVLGRRMESVVEVYGFLATNDFPGSIEEFAAHYGRDVYVGIILPKTIMAHTICSDENWTTGDGLKGSTFRCKVDLPIFPNRYEPQDSPRMDRARIIEIACGGSFIRRSLPSDLY